MLCSCWLPPPSLPRHVTGCPSNHLLRRIRCGISVYKTVTTRPAPSAGVLPGTPSPTVRARWASSRLGSSPTSRPDVVPADKTYVQGYVLVTTNAYKHVPNRSRQPAPGATVTLAAWQQVGAAGTLPARSPPRRGSTPAYRSHCLPAETPRIQRGKHPPRPVGSTAATLTAAVQSLRNVQSRSHRLHGGQSKPRPGRCARLAWLMALF